MTQPREPLPPHLAEPSKLGDEVSITGKWIPTKPGGLFRKSAESKEMLQEWEDIHVGARGRSRGTRRRSWQSSRLAAIIACLLSTPSAGLLCGDLETVEQKVETKLELGAEIVSGLQDVFSNELLQVRVVVRGE